MAPKHLLQIRVDGAIKSEAAAVLAAMGMTMSDAVRVMLTRVACEGALPFDPLMPNSTTIAAKMAARVGDSVKVGISDLIADLNAHENPKMPPSPSENRDVAQIALARQILDDGNEVLRILAKT
jgi:DNA-damage-inducible protein J